MESVELLKMGTKILKESSIPDYEDSARRLLALAMGIEFSEVGIANHIDNKSMKKYLRLINDRSNHVPMDKLIGFNEFLGVKIPFNKNVLTPRQESEILADMIVKDISKSKGSIKSLLDMCTGSGCIGLGIANNVNVLVTLSDISTQAIKIAKKNCKLNNKVRKSEGKPPINPTFIISDMFNDIKYTYDVIVCNPPYIKSSDLNKLEIEVRDFDPVLALDGGKDGLDFYRNLIANAPKYLNTDGRLYLEIGVGQSKMIVRLLNKNFEDIRVIQDYSGIDRFIIAKKREKNVK